MRHELSYIDPQKLFIAKTSGKMSADGFIAMAEGLLAHPCWEPDGHVLFDHTGLDFSGLTAADLRPIRDFHKAHEERIGKGKSAIIVKQGAVEAWDRLWSQGQKIVTRNVVGVFDCYDEARNWALSE